MGAFVPFEQICKLLGTPDAQQQSDHDACPGGTTGIQRWSDLNTNPFRHDKDLTISTEIKIIYSAG
jgi:hypothetical protein